MPANTLGSTSALFGYTKPREESGTSVASVYRGTHLDDAFGILIGAGPRAILTCLFSALFWM